MADNPEALLISSLLRDKDFPVPMGAGVSADHFHAYRDEYEFIENYFRRYRRIPTKMAFKDKFSDFTIRPVNDTPHYSDEVLKQHIQHRLLSSIKEVTDYIGSGEIEEAAKLMHSEIVKITAETGGGNDVDLIADWQRLFDDALEKSNRANNEGLAGISTGFPTLDDATGGWQPGEYHIVAARLGEFKSWCMLRGVAAALQAGKVVQFDSLEMSQSQVGFRMHSLLSGAIGRNIFSNIELQQGRNFDARAYRAFLRKIPSIIKGQFRVTDGSRGRISPISIAAQIERNKPDIVFVDYIQLMEGAMGGDWRSIGQVSGELKSLAQQYQIPIVAAAQLNRERGIGKDPATADALAGSDAIGQDADSVVTGKKLSESVLMLYLAKYRHGPSGRKLYVDARPASGSFEEVSFNRAMELKDLDLDAIDAAEAASPPKVRGRMLGGMPVNYDNGTQQASGTRKKLVRKPSPR